MSLPTTGAVFAVSASAALLLGILVARGHMVGADRRGLARFQPRTPTAPDGRPTRAITAARDISALGGDTLRVVFLLGCMTGLVAHHRPAAAALLFAVFAGARVALLLLKRIARRPRPDLFAHGVATYTTSFPSGHTFMATVLYLSAALIVPLDGSGVALAFAGVVSLSVGVTRLVLGIHWPSDVAMGWLAGVAWVSGCALLWPL